MSAPDLLKTDILAYLHQHENKDLLRFITCGSVDDGKSTLIGRLLHDTKMIYEDQLAAISKDSKTHGTVGNEVDLALLVDGLQSEREQGITIDVAYRYFSTDKRKFIIADTPGHEQYTRNMATGASTANLAILLIDARYGVQTQTRRHSFICSLLGIRHFVVAVNKMDLIGYDEQTFLNIQAEFEVFAQQLKLPQTFFVPVSALAGDNITTLSDKTPWYKGNPLLSILEEVNVVQDANLKDLRLPVQHVNRPNLNFRGFSGTLASGSVQPGTAIKTLPSGKTSIVEQLLVCGKAADTAWPGDAITVTLKDEIDISRGDLIVQADAKITPTDQIEIDVVWMHETPLTCHKQYVIKIGPREVYGYVEKILYEVDVNTQEQHEVTTLQLNSIGRCQITLTEPVVADPYKTNPKTGGLIFIDRLSNITVGAGMIHTADSQTNHRSMGRTSSLTPCERGAKLYQKPALLFLHGSETFCSTLAVELETQLNLFGHLAFNLRKTQAQNWVKTLPENHQVSFWNEQISTLLSAGLIVIVSAFDFESAKNQFVAQTNAIDLITLEFNESEYQDAPSMINALKAGGILL